MADARETKGKAAPKAKGKAKAASGAKSPATRTKKKEAPGNSRTTEIQAMAVADARANPTRVVASPESDAPEERGPVIERGDIFFFYRPDIDDEAPGGLLDVRRFHVVLRPADGD